MHRDAAPVQHRLGPSHIQSSPLSPDPDFLREEVRYLKGVGEKRADVLREHAGICTVRDLLRYHLADGSMPGFAASDGATGRGGCILRVARPFTSHVRIPFGYAHSL